MNGAEVSAEVDREQMGPWSNSGWKGALEVTHPTAWGTKQVWFCQVAQSLVLLNFQLPVVMKYWSYFYFFFLLLWSLGDVETPRSPVWHLDWVWGRGFSLRGLSCTGTGSPRMQSLHQACWSLRSIWTVLLVIWSEFLGRPVWCQELDSTILMGPFQLGIFYDSMILWKEDVGMLVVPPQPKAEISKSWVWALWGTAIMMGPRELSWKQEKASGDFIYLFIYFVKLEI